MSANSDEKELLKKLRQLEAENARLRARAETGPVSQLTVTEGEYLGHPVLTFDGSFRRFTLGLKKLTVIQQAWPEVEAFLKRHAKTILIENDDIKI